MNLCLFVLLDERKLSEINRGVASFCGCRNSGFFLGRAFLWEEPQANDIISSRKKGGNPRRQNPKSRLAGRTAGEVDSRANVANQNFIV